MAITKQFRHPEFMTNSLFETMRLQLIALQQFHLNCVLTHDTALVIGTTSNLDIRVNVAVNYVRDAIRRTPLAAQEIDVPAGATMANDGTARQVVVLVYISATDVLTALASPIARSGATAVIPQLPTGCVQLGYVRIAAAAGTAYTANTTALNAAGLTTTFVNALVPEQNWLEPARMGTM